MTGPISWDDISVTIGGQPVEGITSVQFAPKPDDGAWVPPRGGYYTASSKIIIADEKAVRALVRFVRQVRHLSTPYAKGRGLKKPRGAAKKWRAFMQWHRHITMLRIAKWPVGELRMPDGGVL